MTEWDRAYLETRFVDVLISTSTEFLSLGEHEQVVE